MRTLERSSLASKLRWRSQIQQVETKLMIRHKTFQIIMSSTWESSLTTKKRIYLAILRLALSHEATMWYTSKKIKRYKKKVDSKMRSIQGRALRQVIETYRVTSTKVLQIEINTTSINIHLSKLIQRSIFRLNAQESSKAIEVVTTQIRKNISFKKNRKSKLRSTSLQLKRKWMRKILEKTTISRS